MYVAPIKTPAGVFTAYFTEDGLARLEFPGNHKSRRSVVRLTKHSSPTLQRWVAQTQQALTQVLAGCKPTVLPPFDLSAGTDFQKAVWLKLCTIAPGQTRSYGQVAEALRRPKAARAVGQACGANPIPVLIPCHRVLAANGALGGFSSGLDWKRQLLAREGVKLVRPMARPRA
jgi:O-6-methylguanine DNA methyltransferase